MKRLRAGLPRYRLLRNSLLLRSTSAKSFGKPQDAQVGERLEGYIGGRLSASLIASREEECEQIQRGPASDC